MALADTGAGETKVGAPSPAARAIASGAKDVGLGRSDPTLPLPPAPKALPITRLNPGQVMLRAIIVLASAYILVQLSQFVLQSGGPLASTMRAQVCAAMPNLALCRD